MAPKGKGHLKTNKPNKINQLKAEEDGESGEKKTVCSGPRPMPDPDMFGGVHKSVLEAFDNLNWHDDWNEDQKVSFARQWIPPESKTISHAMKLIDSEMARFYAKEYTIPPWPEDESKVVFYLPGLKPNHQTVSPKHSVLTPREQTQLYFFYCRMAYRNTKRPLDEKELAQFQELRAKVAEEVAEFQELAKSEWYRGMWKRVLETTPQVEQFIDSLWIMRTGQSLTYYPDDCKSVKDIPLSFHDPNNDFCIFEFSRSVLSQGLPLKMSLIKTKEPWPLITDIEHLARIKPVSKDFNSRPKPFIRSITPVSVDFNVERILRRNDLDIDVVISMSGIKTLIDNIKFQREWVLPVTVEEVLKDDGETVKKVVLIDKNLPPNAMSVHEKNLWHAKVVAKWMLVLSNTPDLFCKKEKPKESESYEEMLNEVVEKLNEVKSTGKIELKSDLGAKKKSEVSEEHKELDSNKNKPKSRISVGNDCNNRTAGDRTLTSYDDLPKDVVSEESFKKPVLGDKAGKKSESKTTFKPKRSVINITEDLHKKNKKMETMNRGRQSLSYDDPFADFSNENMEEFGVDPIPTKVVCTEEIQPKRIASSDNSAEGSPVKKMKGVGNASSSASVATDKMIEDGEIPVGGAEKCGINLVGSKRGRAPCLQYQIWNLHKSKYTQFLKGEQRNLKVLVRTRKDGKLFHYQDGNRMLDDICVSSKLEFQPEYGASKMATSELIREYLDLYMRPDSKLVRVRSVGHTKEVMMTEVKTLADVKTALQGEGMQVQRLFDPLYAVLTKLIDLPPGRYMLQHLARMGAFATLYVEAPGGTGFSLPQYCQELTKLEVNVPPMAIDPLVLTPLQHRDRVAPALFTPGFTKVSKGTFFSKPKNPVDKSAKKLRKKRQKLRKKQDTTKSQESWLSVKS